MFNQGDVIFYPFPGYGKGTIVDVGTSDVFGSTSDITYRIEFELGNTATLFDNPRLVAWNPNDERLVEMANQYTKEAQLAGKKTKDRVEKAAKAPKAPKEPKGEGGVKKAKDATKSTAPEGSITFKEAKARWPEYKKIDRQLYQDIRAGKVDGGVLVGKTWYFPVSEVEARLSKV